jgi:type I restriction enzyme M protein
LNAPAKGIETVPKELMRWSKWAQGYSGENLVRFVRDEVFPFYHEVAAQAAQNFMANARLGIDEPTVLTQSCSWSTTCASTTPTPTARAICSNTS